MAKGKFTVKGVSGKRIKKHGGKKGRKRVEKRHKK